jgi:hypothetical protein
MATLVQQGGRGKLILWTGKVQPPAFTNAVGATRNTRLGVTPAVHLPRPPQPPRLPPSAPH